MSAAERTDAQTERFVAMVCAKQGWAANPDAAFRAQVERGLTVNFRRYGYYLCPCRDGDGERAADADIVCPCAYSAADVAEFGHCFCGLYLRPDFAAGPRPPAPIPERRKAPGDD